MIAGRRARLALLWTLLLAGCAPASRDATQIIVVVDAEPGVRSRMTMLELEVRGTFPESRLAYSKPLLASVDLALPYTLALAPKDGDENRRFEVLIRAWNRDSEIVAQARALSHFVAHQKLLLPLMLRDDCLGIVCNSAETCEAGLCGSASIDPASLEQFTGGEAPPAIRWSPDAGQLDPDRDGGAPVEPVEPVDPACPNGLCPCEDGSMRACGGTERGECEFGVQLCVDSRWQSCMGQRTATREVCNGLDDDCNGNIDDFVQCDPLSLAQTSAAVCSAGVCRPSQCDASWDDCNQDRDLAGVLQPVSDGCEQSLATSEACGACGTTCEIDNAVASCGSGACLVAQCDTDWADCDQEGTSCETPLDTLQDCGGCGTSCAFDHGDADCGGSFGSHSCELVQCDTDWDDCNADQDDGCEVDLDGDVSNCGACDNDCINKANVASASCNGGTCSIVCEQDTLDCDEDPDNGCEVDLAVSTCARCFSGASNLTNLESYSYSAAADFSCGGTHTFNSTNKSWSPSGCCGGPCPEASGPVSQGSSYPQLVILRAESLSIGSGTTVRLVGQYPVVFAVRGNATIAGTLDASAAAEVPGAGGNLGCSSSTGQAGVAQYDPMTMLDNYSSGGGGGGFASSGGLPGGSPVPSRSFTGARGTTHGNTDLSPLYGGCAGGLGHVDAAFPCTSGSQLAGAGGGGVQLVVTGKLTLSGTLIANGGVGGEGCQTASRSGGSGGGSGGAFLLEATMFDLTGTLSNRSQIRGGRGGDSSSGANGGQGSQSAVTGSTGSFSAPSGGGGGGGYGRVYSRSCL